MSNKKALILGFVVGGALVIAAALYFYPASPSAKPVAMPVAGSAATTPAQLPAGHPEPHATAADGKRPASPHSFPAMPEAESSAPLLSGTINLDPSITQSPGAAVTVFIIARTGPGKGQPVLAKRIDAQSFPLSFTLTGGDSMMAGNKPSEVSLEARIDLDGDAMTREPGSPIARLAAVSLGSKTVAMTLKPEA